MTISASMLVALGRISRRPRLSAAATLLIAALVVVCGLSVGLPGRSQQTATRNGGGITDATRGTSAPVPVPVVPPEQLAALPEATTSASLPSAPVDTRTAGQSDGVVVHNSETLPIFAEPGGAAFGKLPTTQIGSDTWLPVIDEQPGWFKVLLPARPNGASGWLDAGRTQPAHSPYQIRVHLGSTSIEVLHDGQPAGNWRVGIGKSDTPTPLGRTFLLASIRDSHQTFSPVILPLGTHSPTLDSFGGGPGTVAIHTWPTTDVYGTASSHGCVRVPPDALQILQNVPLGTLVLITDS